MIIGVVFAGVISGALSVIWAISAGLPALLVVLMYPSAGIAGALAFLALCLYRTSRADDFSSGHVARNRH